jgi:hypothetical protein
MLQRYSQVGEYYLMQKPASVPEGAKNYMDILVYDEERDTHAQIPFGDALVATGFFKKNGDTIAIVTQPAQDDPNYPDVKAAFDNLGSSVSGDLTVSQWATAALALYTSAKNGVAIADGQKANADKVVVCLARPFIEHSMLSAILCVAGADTGATLFGPSDMRTPRIRCRTHGPCVDRQTHQRWNCFRVCLRRDLGQHVGQDDRGVRTTPTLSMSML